MPRDHRTQGAGSGVIISKEGYILTNNHVVDGAKEVTVTMANKKEYKAQVVGRDSKTDLAVLKVETNTALPAKSWGDSDKSRVGDWVLAVGNPFGLGGTATVGITAGIDVID